jgi:outer membrane protein
MKKLSAMIAISGSFIACVLAGPAAAGDYKGNFMVRAGVSGIIPDSSANVSIGGINIPGLDAEVSTEVVPTATLSYFFTNNVAVELLCCFAKHDVSGRDGLAGVDLGSTWIFPPALTLQYHFDPMNGFKPYLGVGLQYIKFFNGSNSDLGGKIKIDDAVGFTLQAGIDIEIGQGWYVNADVRKTWLSTDARWQGTDVRADVELDPLIVTAAVGYRFNLGDLFDRGAPSYK